MAGWFHKDRFKHAVDGRNPAPVGKWFIPDPIIIAP